MRPKADGDLRTEKGEIERRWFCGGTLKRYHKWNW